jgi:hypothetical protein
MLRPIAAALSRRVEIRFVPVRESAWLAPITRLGP